MYIHLHVGTFINGENTRDYVTFCINEMSKNKAGVCISEELFLSKYLVTSS